MSNSTVDLNLIEDLAHAIVGCREFCGNEREAILDWMTDNDLTKKEFDSNKINSAIMRANEIWLSYRKDAGVFV